MTYRDTYHGQVNQLGYTYTAKCFDCHDSHEIQRVDDPESKVHPDNRLEDLPEVPRRQEDCPLATAGFTTFGPHANDHDFEQLSADVDRLEVHDWLLIVRVRLLLGAFVAVVVPRMAGSQGRASQAARATCDGLPLDGNQAGPALRAAVAAGPPAVRPERHDAGADRHDGVLFADTDWAPVGREGARRPARCAASSTGSARRSCSRHSSCIHCRRTSCRSLLRNRKTFRWFGPDSLIPNWKDLEDCHRHVQVVLQQGTAADLRPLDLLREVRLLGGVLGHGHHRLAAA